MPSQSQLRIRLLQSHSQLYTLNISLILSPFILINYYAPNNENGQIQVLNEIQEQFDLLDLDQDTQIIWGGESFRSHSEVNPMRSDCIC